MASYIGLVHKDPDSDFGISFPDFPGCVSVGSTLDDVRIMGAEALEFHIRGMIEDGKPIPPPSPLEEIEGLPDFKDGLPVLITIPDMPAIPVRVEVILSPETVAGIDDLAKRRGVSRATIVRDAARQAVDPAA